VVYLNFHLSNTRTYVRVQGYDVVALSGPGRFVVGLDICDTAIQKAKQLVI
jgi:hypothetical protein